MEKEIQSGLSALIPSEPCPYCACTARDSGACLNCGAVLDSNEDGEEESE